MAKNQRPLRISWSDFNWQRGALFTTLLVVMMILSGFSSVIGIIAASSVLLAMMSVGTGPLNIRITTLAFFTPIGLAMIPLVEITRHGFWSSALLIFAVTLGAGFIMLLNDMTAKPSLLLNLWLFYLFLLTTMFPLWQVMAGFALGCGGVLVTLVLLGIRRGMPREELSIPVLIQHPLRTIHDALMPHMQWHDRLFRFSFIRACVIAFGYFIGWMVFREHPYWVATTTLMVVRPTFDQALIVGVQRAVGTLIGVLVGVAFVQIIAHPLALVAGLFVAGFGLGASSSANYAIYIMFLTLMLLGFSHLLGADDIAMFGAERLIETMFGLLFGLIIITMVSYDSLHDGEHAQSS